MATKMKPTAVIRDGPESPMVSARMPLEQRWTLTFIRNERCYELDVLWMTATAWRRRRDRDEWATVSMGPFVIGLRMIV